MGHFELYDDYDDYDDLIVRYLAAETTSEEESTLINLIKSSDEFAEHFLVIKKIWELAENPDEYSEEDISSHYEEVMGRIKKLRYRNFFYKSARYFQKATAILFIPLILALGFLLKSPSSGGTQFMPISQEIIAMHGTRIHTFLPDSTEVWLNGGSSLIYSQESPDGRRIIDLKGEVFFNVAHDADHPFVVNTRNLSVEAIGTEFNVCSYPTDSLTSVTLTDGSVLVSDTLTQSVLTPGQMVVYNNNIRRGKLYLGNTDKMTSWREGRLVFKNEPLCNVYKRLGQIYGIRFEVDPKLQEVMFYATFEDASLEQILQLIKKSTSLEYSSDNNNKSISNNSIIHVKIKS